MYKLFFTPWLLYFIQSFPAWKSYHCTCMEKWSTNVFIILCESFRLSRWAWFKIMFVSEKQFCADLDESGNEFVCSRFSLDAHDLFVSLSRIVFFARPARNPNRSLDTSCCGFVDLFESAFLMLWIINRWSTNLQWLGGAINVYVIRDV